MSVITTGLTITATAPYGSLYYGELPILADRASVNQYCTEKGYTSPPTSFTSDEQRFSNDGGRMMNQYMQINVAPTGVTYENHWVNVFGYNSIVTSITE
jgi:hypothetical protein